MIQTDKIYPEHVEISDLEAGTGVMGMNAWYGDEVQIKMHDENHEDISKGPVRFNWEGESGDDEENAQNTYRGNLTGVPKPLDFGNYNDQFMQEAPNDEIEIRILEAYDEDCEEEFSSVLLLLLSVLSFPESVLSEFYLLLYED